MHYNYITDVIGMCSDRINGIILKGKIKKIVGSPGYFEKTSLELYDIINELV